MNGQPIPQFIQDYARDHGFNVLDWAERPESWVIITEEGKKLVIDKTDNRQEKALRTQADKKGKKS